MGVLESALLVFLVASVLTEGIAILALARVIGAIQIHVERLIPPIDTKDGLAVGAAAPAITGFHLWTKQTESRDVGSGRWLLIFVSAGCSACRRLTGELSFIGRTKELRGLRVLLIARGQHEQNAIFGQLVSPRLDTFSDPAGEIHQAYEVDQVPQAFVVDGGKIAAKAVVNAREQVETLLQMVARRNSPAPLALQLIPSAPNDLPNTATMEVSNVGAP